MALLDSFQAFSGILVICPCCGDIMRLSELRFQFVGKFERTFLDDLKRIESALCKREQHILRRECKFDEREESLREAAREKGRKQAQKRIYQLDPALKKIKFNPNDIKVVAHPVALIVFDGLNGGSLRNIIFINRCTKRNKNKKKFCKHLDRALTKKRYLWETVTIQHDGTVEIAKYGPGTREHR